MSKVTLKSWRFWAGFVVVVVAALALIWFILGQFAQDTTTLEVAKCIAHEDDESCIQFPTFFGQTLAGEDITFPDIFAAHAHTLIVVVYSREQQEREADRWFPVIAEVETQYPDVQFYGVALISDIAAPARVMASGGMRLQTDNVWHDNVVMVFLEGREMFLEAMEVPDFDSPEFFIVNNVGEVLWRMSAIYTQEGEATLREGLAQIIGG